MAIACLASSVDGGEVARVRCSAPSRGGIKAWHRHLCTMPSVLVGGPHVPIARLADRGHVQFEFAIFPKGVYPGSETRSEVTRTESRSSIGTSGRRPGCTKL